MIPLVRSSVFSLFPQLVCGVSTRIGGASGAQLGMNTSMNVGDEERNVVENRWRMCEALGVMPNRIVWQRQAHGAEISIVDRPCVRAHNDALITQTEDLFLAVSIADCQPVFLYDSANAVVAAVHAGWRGAAQHIAASALARMSGVFGSKPADVFVFVGPAASRCCYEVDAAVASQFPGDVAAAKGGGKYMLDLKAATALDLSAAGVPATHIELSPLCTICQKEFFHSYRRDGARSGRMLGVIGMRKETPGLQ